MQNNLKKLIFFISIFFLSFFANSQIFNSNQISNIDIHLNIEPTFCYTNGTLGESVFRSRPKSKKISFLEWDRKFFTYGGKINFQIKNFFLQADFLTSIPENSGKMQDSDWLNASDYSMKTNYSVGTNYAQNNYDFSVLFKYNFKPLSCLLVSPLVQAQYLYDSFARENCEGWYSDGKHYWNDESSTYYPYYNSETGKTYKLAEIDYVRQSFFSWIGIATRLNFSEKFNVGFSVLMSPFAYFYSVDAHFSQNSDKSLYKNYYRQRQNSYFNYLKMNIESTFVLTKVLDLSLGFSTLFYFRTEKGDLFYKTSYKGEKYENLGQKSSSDIKNINFLVGIKVKIL